jgi:hypothetical protein
MRKISVACSAVSTGRSVGSHHGSSTAPSLVTSTSQHRRNHTDPGSGAVSAAVYCTSADTAETAATTGWRLAVRCPTSRTSTSVSIRATGARSAARSLNDTASSAASAASDR